MRPPLTVWRGRVIQTLNDPLLEIVPCKAHHIGEDAILRGIGDTEVESEVGRQKAFLATQGSFQVREGLANESDVFRCGSLRGRFSGLTLEHQACFDQILHPFVIQKDPPLQGFLEVSAAVFGDEGALADASLDNSQRGK